MLEKHNSSTRGKIVGIELKNKLPTAFQISNRLHQLSFEGNELI